MFFFCMLFMFNHSLCFYFSLRKQVQIIQTILDVSVFSLFQISMEICSFQRFNLSILCGESIEGNKGMLPKKTL